ncbi:TspO/MBR family protein [Mariniflexile ostreae]|uniref:TspO/MBR family protein n=1 Tax=Mariniflexile ostreae TaxID=1520892 RepID=A0ABV5FE31_9FLAO
MKRLKYICVFLVINFSALAIGSWLMGNGPQSDWYQNLDKAPWTPPGWVFGAAWTSIMVCFSIYMAYLYLATPSLKIKSLFVFQFICNVLWNYLFFNQHLIGLALVAILILTVIIGVFMLSFLTQMNKKSLLVLPYFVWLCIASSLNAYVLIYN